MPVPVLPSLMKRTYDKPIRRLRAIVSRWDTFLLLWLITLLFWGESWEAEFGMDAMTYAGLARHIVSTGNWLTLHYSSQAYQNFFQHPPLVMWLLAICFQVIGKVSVATAKIPPFIFCLGTLALTVHWGQQAWGKKRRGEWGGFLAGFILLTSTRFIKYGASPMLDGFLAFWMVLGGSFLLHCLTAKQPRTWIWGPGIGLCISLGFLTKGLPILALVVGALAVWIFSLFRDANDRSLKSLNLGFLLAGLAALLPLLIWIGFGNGLLYLKGYWVESVRDRLDAEGFRGMWAPLRNLCKGYWPWLPFYLYSVVLIPKAFLLRTKDAFGAARKKAGVIERMTALLASLTILGGYSLAGHFFEHYLLPFYPFAAITCSSVLAGPTFRWALGIRVGITCLLFGLTLSLALFPLHIQGNDYKDPQRVLLRQAPSRCSSKVARIFISADETPFWWGIAMGAWYTPWDPQVLKPEEIYSVQADALLLSRQGVDLGKNWLPTSLELDGYRIYQAPGSGLCPEALF